MLVLERRQDERIVLFTSDGPIEVRLCHSGRWGAKLGITAPPDVLILRKEMLTDDQRAELAEASA